MTAEFTREARVVQEFTRDAVAGQFENLAREARAIRRILDEHLPILAARLRAHEAAAWAAAVEHRLCARLEEEPDLDALAAAIRAEASR